jgi:hypothetical protein
VFAEGKHLVCGWICYENSIRPRDYCLKDVLLELFSSGDLNVMENVIGFLSDFIKNELVRLLFSEPDILIVMAERATSGPVHLTQDFAYILGNILQHGNELLRHHVMIVLPSDRILEWAAELDGFFSSFSFLLLISSYVRFPVPHSALQNILTWIRHLLDCWPDDIDIIRVILLLVHDTLNWCQVDYFSDLLDFVALFQKGDVWVTKLILIIVGSAYIREGKCLGLDLRDFLDCIYNDSMDCDVRHLAASSLLEMVESGPPILVWAMNDLTVDIIPLMINRLEDLPLCIRCDMTLVLFHCATKSNAESVGLYLTESFLAISISALDMRVTEIVSGFIDA